MPDTLGQLSRQDIAFLQSIAARHGITMGQSLRLIIRKHLDLLEAIGPRGGKLVKEQKS